MNKNYRTTAYFLAIIACAGLLTGCFFGPSPLTPEERAEKVGEFIAKGGYSPKRLYEIDSSHEIWRHDGQAIEISMLAPKASGHYPLIVYLPGLGEHADGGRLWRETWAKAGYAVFSVQPLEIGEALNELAPMPGDDKESGDEDSWFSSSKDKDKSASLNAVRNSDLRYLGHEFFSQEALKTRLNHLLWAYSQLQQRTEARQGLFAAVDLSRMVIAGYDIGAQAASEMIGEKFAIELPQAPDFKPLAAILLSPSVDMALGDLTTRYKNISIPFLEVTGTEDDDPFAITTPYVRTAIWEYAPSGNKYLLLLNKGGHQLLAGSNLSHRQEPSPSQEDNQKTGQGDDIPRFANSYRGGGGRSGGSAGGLGGMGGPRNGGRHDNEQDIKHIAAVLSISTAFLDSVTKSDKAAQLWITEDANQWLTKSVHLKIK